MQPNAQVVGAAIAAPRPGARLAPRCGEWLSSRTAVPAAANATARIVQACRGEGPCP